MRYCCMFEIITIQMHKLFKIPGIVKSPKQLCSAQCFLSSAETRWRSNHELALLCLSSKTRQARHPCWMRAHVITLPSNLKTWCAGGWGGGVNRTTRSGCVPEQVWTGHGPETGTVPVNLSRCERYTNEWNGTGTGPEREPEQVWTGPYRLLLGLPK